MSRIEKQDEVRKTFERQAKPCRAGTLKRVDVELANLLDGDHDLPLGEDWYDTLTDLRKQVQAAI